VEVHVSFVLADSLNELFVFAAVDAPARSTIRYDPRQDTWTSVASLPHALLSPAALAWPNGCSSSTGDAGVMVLGGRDGRGNTDRNLLYDVRADRWQQVPWRLSCARWQHTALAVVM
jgi:hypothetical protein